MSIATDITSLELIARVHRTTISTQLFETIVHKLVSQVNHIDWAAIYWQDDDLRYTVTSSNGEMYPPEDVLSKLKVPILGPEQSPTGYLVVTSFQLTPFDETDLSTLNTLASEISQKMFLN
ncbi:GAF domain-containing protein [Microaerobacter geothermalis]|uniref:GAF domain-containing protein n=1 Tax=Microaerobacter geothermalis TaxID=674972 RepID=UPI001F47AA0E|nr:GAF domain-containing protein [Microaerobacter geothermalis]MCF6095345.1 GAF domain-containing protein [Microaerobacter geothermalis]